jgi:hypothetical protein
MSALGHKRTFRSQLFNAAERAALDLAVAGASVPNAVTDEMFSTLRAYWSEEQIVEIVGVIAMFGFLNRWNDTLATPLEEEPITVGQKYLAPHGWSAGNTIDEPSIPNAERQWGKYRRVCVPLGAIPER